MRTAKTLVSFRLSDGKRDELQECVDLLRVKEGRPGGHVWMVTRVNRTEVIDLAVSNLLVSLRREEEEWKRQEQERSLLVNIDMPGDDAHGRKIKKVRKSKVKS